MWKKSKLVLLSSALAFSLTSGSTSFIALAANDIQSNVKENVNQNYVKVKYENKILFHEQVPSKVMIRVLNTNSEVIESQVLTGDTELVLETPKNISRGKMLSYWSIERVKDKFTIEPILIDAKDVMVNFYTNEGGELIENNAQIREISKSVNEGTNLKDILPEVNPKNGYKFAGWFKVQGENEEKLNDIDEIKVIDAESKYSAKFYQDLNGNGIDDQTEEVTVKFVTNATANFADVKANVGTQIKLPKVEKKNSVFLGWYTDQDYKTQFKGDVVTESITLYAKWGNVDKVIQESEKKPITDKDISDQIEKILNKRLKELNTTSVSTSSNKPTQTTSTKDINTSKEQSSTQTIPAQNTFFKEVEYVFNNKNSGHRFMVKFLNEDNSFLFSLTLPYGKTIKIYDENQKFHEEYAVRQDTTITLNSKEYVNEGSQLINYETHEVRVNSAKITEIYPVVEVENTMEEELAYEHAKAMEEEYQAAKKKKDIILVSSLVIGLGSLLVASIFLFVKRKKRNKALETI